MNIMLEKDFIKLRNGLDRPAFKALEGLKDLVGAEIGVQHGVNAYDILETYDIKKLYLIDPYVIYPGVSGNIAGNNFEYAKNTAYKYLEKFSDKIEWIEKFSWNAVNYIPDNLDFVYIDGDHRKHSLEKDLRLYYPKVKSGGLFAGHDYASRALQVMEAVNEFFEIIPEELHYGGKWDWWTIKK